MIQAAYFEEEPGASKVDLSLWKQLFAYTKPYRKELRLLICTGAATAACDALFPIVTKRVIDDIAVARSLEPLGRHAFTFAALSAMLCACIWGFIYLAGKIRTHASHDIRRAGFDRLQQLSFSYFDKRPVGWLMARMTSDCERLSNILAWGVLDIFWGTTLLICITVGMFLLSAKLALAVLCVLPLLFIVSSWFRKRILDSARHVRRTNSRITAAYNEGIMGVRTSKAFVREDANLDAFGELTDEMFRASVRNLLLSAAYLPLVLAIGSIATAAALVLGGFDVTTGAISVGTLIAFIMYTRQFFEPVNQMAHWFAEMQMAQASAERILGLIATEPEIRDSSEVAARGPETGPIGRIEFRDVSFSYGGDGPRVLERFNLTVEPGETVALVGATGGGKSTIVSLLCRFYEPTEGSILLDGVDYRERSLHWLQSNLGMVLQTPHLFSGSIADNIRYGALDATDEDVVETAKLVGAHEFVAAMKDGYESQVGEGGVRLSTGQKQLLSFARAILARPQLLVMDEATSSVDTETEQQIQEALGKVLEGRTSFVIAHRLSTIRAADRILVIEKGRIAEMGDHRALMAQDGHYRDLYVQQSLRTAWG